MWFIATYKSILRKLSEGGSLWVVTPPRALCMKPRSDILITWLITPCITPEGEKTYSILRLQWNAVRQAWESDTPGFSPGSSTLWWYDLDQIIELPRLRFLIYKLGCGRTMRHDVYKAQHIVWPIVGAVNISHPFSFFLAACKELSKGTLGFGHSLSCQPEFPNQLALGKKSLLNNNNDDDNNSCEHQNSSDCFFNLWLAKTQVLCVPKRPLKVYKEVLEERTKCWSVCWCRGKRTPAHTFSPTCLEEKALTCSCWKHPCPFPVWVCQTKQICVWQCAFRNYEGSDREGRSREASQHPVCMGLHVAYFFLVLGKVHRWVGWGQLSESAPVSVAPQASTQRLCAPSLCSF